MVRLVAYAVAVILLMTRATIAQPVDQFLVVPGQSIGPVKIDDMVTEAMHTLGPVRVTSTDDDRVTRYRWYEIAIGHPLSSPGGVFVDAGADGAIMRAGVFCSARYHLINGLHPRDCGTFNGSRESDVIRLMGEPRSRSISRAHRMLAYSGVLFWVDNNNNDPSVSQIDVERIDGEH